MKFNAILNAFEYAFLSKNVKWFLFILGLIPQYVSNELLISYNYRYQILYRHTEVFRFVEGSLQSRNHSCMPN